MVFNEGNKFLEIEKFQLFGLEIGPIVIAWYAVLILTGAMVAMVLAIREGKKIGVNKDFVIDTVLYGIPISVIGARLYYVIFAWDYYKDNPIDALKIYEGGLAIHGAVIFAVIWGYYFSKRRKVEFLRAIDLAAPGFLIAQGIGRWGNFMNQEAHGGKVPGATLVEQVEYLTKVGIPKFVIDRMYINGAYMHPTFFYEFLWNLCGFTLMLILRRTKYLYVGDLGLVYMMWYSFGRCIIEEMRTDSLYLGHTGIRVAQLISGLMFVSGAVILILRHYYKWNPKYYYKLLEENRGEVNE